MASSPAIPSFPQIDSFEALCGYCSPLDHDERGILALDLDQVLVQCRPTLGDEHWYTFLVEQNKTMGKENIWGHYHWTVKVRKELAYETCEAVEKVNQVISQFRERGWTVKILTSRGFEMQEMTDSHLQESGLTLTIDDVIFKRRRDDGGLAPKDECLENWMKSQPERDSKPKARVLFVDDSISYCSEVARTQAASVTCLQYTAALPNPELSQKQMERLIVQLFHYREKRDIYGDYTETQLPDAMAALGVERIEPQSLYHAMVKVAELDGHPF